MLQREFFPIFIPERSEAIAKILKIRFNLIREEGNMRRKYINYFNMKGEEFEISNQLPDREDAKFILSVDKIEIGILSSKEGEWWFKYSDEFKKFEDKYNRIIGFPDLNKIYKSKFLWPFFKIRIPGLKQPAIREIIAKENIDDSNEAALLKRFGKKTIANQYELVMS